MKIEIIAVGKLKMPFIQEGEAKYHKRIKPYSRISVTEIAAARGKSSKPLEVMQDEGLKILAKIKSDNFVVALDEAGTDLSSVQFARLFEEGMNTGRSEFVFVIGGAFGLSSSVKERADLLLSLSKMTFPYQLCRLMLAEQIYRGMSIVHGLPYHKA